MTVGRKGAHVVADLGDQRLSDVVADAGDVFQSLDGLAKGVSAASRRASNSAIVASICSIVFNCWPIRKR